MKILCIYHGGCDDGFGAAWAIRHALGEDAVEFYPGIYQDAPPDVTGRDVILVDFCYKRPVLMEMAAKANSILILDHHKTAAEDLAEFPKISHRVDWPAKVRGEPPAQFKFSVQVLFDMNRSGAGIAWDFFHPGVPRPEFIDYLEDRDLWRKALPGGDEFTIALRSYSQCFAAWDGLVKRGVQPLIEQGIHIQRYYRCRIEELKKDARMSAFCDWQVLVSNSPYFAASEVAGELAEGMPFGASFFERADGMIQYSLRSRDGVDVSEIAKKFGGGGHRNAAGFAVPSKVHVPNNKFA